jgi:hypothetical protein
MLKEAETQLAPLKQSKGSPVIFGNIVKRGKYALKKENIDNLIKRIHWGKETLNIAIVSLQLHEQTRKVL